MAEEKVLSYNDVVLRRSDLEILQGPHYINDRIIEFYWSYLSTTVSDRILFVPPSISFWIANCPDSQSLLEAVNPLNFSARDLVVFTVNDSSDFTQAEGGAHWSLLVYERANNVVVHHDSLTPMNRSQARRFFKTVKGFLGDGSEEVRFIEGQTPQQTNAYDCGLYVMRIGRVVCDWFEGQCDRGIDLWFSELNEEVDTVVVANLRNEVLELILGFMNKSK
ncbi:Ulp1 peptidase protein [Dioscorea alata]|uniref:Ulp1 peptidase protein n=1 Tax=Dioscorea alata TaxID=55571 RepID=A0ACB7U944_DIOAL|nr:Ulp1 peptidase protein [Dioscorea alata]